MTDGLYLRTHVQLANSVDTSLLIRQERKLVVVLVAEFADWRQPMLYEALLRPVKDCPNATTAIVSAHDDVFDFQRLDRKLQDRHTIEIGWIDEVGNVAMHEDLARLQARNDISRHAAVGTADPKEFGRL